MAIYLNSRPSRHISSAETLMYPSKRVTWVSGSSARCDIQRELVGVLEGQTRRKMMWAKMRFMINLKNSRFFKPYI
ncbi:predicted protein [Botrytis cinerea T4]|uniref:Uncharacterized protein n=1 Tax=Botryotinia fuckeliana (strain T4) TaxID=999810 RepID=G2YK25_BOTF4|nr:predicted protein [Botrytis cinerea T4]